MIAVKEDLTGRVFGRWTVDCRADDHISPSGRAYDMWWCRCSCEKQTYKKVYGDNLRGNKSQSCGCLSVENKHNSNLNTHNKYDKYNQDFIIGYTQNNEPFYFDKEDFDTIKQFIWYIGKDGYVVTHNLKSTKENGLPKLIRMHRLVLKINDKNTFVDHQNRCRNDNRKKNLRIATARQNSMNSSKQVGDNTSKFKGVCYHKNAQKWVAYINIDEKRVHLGIFNSEIEAAKAYDKAAVEHFGEFACTNLEVGDLLDVC